MFSMVLLIIIILICLLGYYHWSRRHMYEAARKIKGPPGLPLLGNILFLTGNPEELFDRINSIISKVSNEPTKFWLGPFLLIILKNPEYLQTIMTSSKFAYKDAIYDILGNFLGNGLISASGSNYKLHRKAIQPLFNMKYIEDTTEIFQKYINICLERLENYIDIHNFDIMDEIHECMVDFNIEVILGMKADHQNKNCQLFIQGLIDLYDLTFERMVKIWLHPNFIYNILPQGKRCQRVKQNLHCYINDSFRYSMKRKLLRLNENIEEKFVPIIDKLTELEESNQILFSQKDLEDHLLTLVTASQDPVGLITAFGIICFGMYPEYQKKVVTEILSIIGNDPKTLSTNDLNQLKYLDMCVKELTRLFPIAPLIMRRNVNDYQLDQWLIPRGCAIGISIFNLHRDPQYWTNPNHFYPDHFLPEAVAKRHPYTFLPFSAGPRSCIGKNVANIQIKQFLVSFLLKYEVEADGQVPDLKLKCDIPVRSKNGYICRIRKRL